MRQFDVFANPSPASRAYAPYVVVLQSHHLQGLDTVVIAPLVIDATPALNQVDVPLRFDGRDLWLAMAEMSNAPVGRLGRKRGDLVAYYDDIRRAIERIFTGF